MSLNLDLPTAALNWEKFEKFLEDLLVRLRLVPGATPRLVSSSGFGRQGQDQKGIDQLGAYDDGTTGTWQCKQHATLSAADVREIIKGTKVQADKHVVVFSRVADALAREEAAKVPGWEIWDRDDLADLVRILPKHEGRTLLDEYLTRPSAADSSTCRARTCSSRSTSSSVRSSDPASCFTTGPGWWGETRSVRHSSRR